ncbi:MAG: response regulator [Schleiferiaceae bacterium]|jgi:DNA-binding response OmpR family regulator
MTQPKANKIIAVDDNVMMRSLLENVLSRKYEVNVMEDGQQALEWLYAGNIPDLIIADLNMPEVSGFEFLEKVKESGFFEQIPVIVLSGEEGSATRVKVFENKGNDYILKPFNPKELIYRIDNLLRLTGKI